MPDLMIAALALLAAILVVLIVIAGQVHVLIRETETAGRNVGYVINMLSMLTGRKKES